MKKLGIYFRHAHRQKVCLYLELVSNYDAFEVFPKHLLKTCTRFPYLVRTQSDTSIRVSRTIRVKTNKHYRHIQTNKNSTTEIYLVKKWVAERLTCHCTAPNFTLILYDTSACYFDLYSKYTLMKKSKHLTKYLHRQYDVGKKVKKVAGQNSGAFVPLRYRTRRLRTTRLERSYHI